MENVNITDITTKVLSGLLSNPNVVTQDHQFGWSLCNCSNQALVEFCVEIAKEVIKQTENLEENVHMTTEK